MKLQGKSSIVSVLASGVCVFALAQSASAATYYWKSPEAYADYGDTNNWSTVGIDGEAAAALPGENDTLYSQGTYRFDLGGGTYTLGSYNPNSNWNRYYTYIQNGTLLIKSMTTHSGTVTIENGGSLIYPVGSTFNPAQGDAGTHTVNVKEGANYEIRGRYLLYKSDVHVDEGATFVCAPTELNFSGTAQHSYFYINGTAKFPLGLLHNGGANSSTALDVILYNTGTLELGGKLNMNNQPGTYKFQVYGGKISATTDVEILDFDTAEIMAGAPLEIEVAGDSTLDLSTVSISPTASITKTGDGTLVLADCQMLTLNEGTVSLTAFNTALSSLSGTGGAIEIAAPGLVINCAVPEGIGFKVKGGVFSTGDIIVQSSNSDTLAAIKTSLEAAGLNINQDGSALKLGASAYVFNSTTVTDLLTAAGWQAGSVPPDGVEVLISGEGVAATLSTDTFPAWSLIEVGGGATLTISADIAAMVPIKVTGDSEIIISSAVTLPGVNFARAAGQALPKLTIASTGTVTVPLGTTFGNVNLSLSGTLASDGTLSLGYAAAGETAGFAMTVDGGKLDLPAGAAFNLVCPASGGRVEVEDAISIDGLTYTNPALIWSIGVNNPADTPFTVNFTDTEVQLATSTAHKFSGAAEVSFVEGAYLHRPRPSNAQSDDTRITVEKAASVAFVNGGYLKLPVTGNGAGSRITFNPDAVSNVLTVTNGGVFSPRMQFGNDKGTAVFGDSIWEYDVPGWWGENSNKPFVFYGLSGVELLEGTTLTVQRNFYNWGSNQQEGNNPGNAAVAYAPISGGGSLAFTVADAALAKKYTSNFYFNGSGNTATGTLSCATGRGAMLYLNDGADWAGTLVANSAVALRKATIGSAGTITADDSAPVTISVGGIDFQDNFTYRIWKTADGFVNDKVNVGALGFISSAEGRTIALNFVNSYQPLPGDAWNLGTIPADCELPAPPSEKWRVYTEPIDGDTTRVSLMIGPVSLAYNFISTTSEDINDSANWECGFVPVGKEVIIKGEGVTATETALENMPAFASIEVKEGATLKLRHTEGTLELPALAIDATSSVIVGGEDSAPVVRLATPPATYPADGLLPTILVNAGATLVLPANTQLRNCDLQVSGVIQQEGPLFLGYADANETGLFKLTVDGGAISNGGNYALSFYSPAANGTVAMPEGFTALLRNANIYTGTGTISFGNNNPAEVPLPFTVDHTDIALKTAGGSGDIIVAGGTVLDLQNGSRLYRHVPGSTQGDNCNPEIKGNAKVIVSGSNADSLYDVWLPFCGNGGCRFKYNPLEADFPSLTLRDGARYAVWKTEGNGNAILATSNAVCQVGMTYWWSQKPDPFAGLKAVDIAQDSVLTLRREKFANADGYVNGQEIADASGDNMLRLNNTMVFAGAGDLVVSNTYNKAFHVLFRSAANTASGTLSVFDYNADNAGKTKVFFDNGANWAGTVLWTDKIALGDPTAGTPAPVTVSFGAVDLQEDFPIRAWIDDQGNMTNDKVNLTGAGFTGNGKVVIEMQDDAEIPEGAAFYPLGIADKNATLPTLKGGKWRVKTQAIADDDDHVVYGISRNIGFFFTIF